jgi:RNA polymerase sigma-70 factor (ECF subfamily)
MSETLTMAFSRPNTTAFSFDALYREAAADVHAYAWSILRDRSAAEDVTALAFERAYRRRNRFDARRGSARAWLFAIARNAALDELRRRRRTAALTFDPAAETEPAAEGPELERRATVTAALASLDPRDRELVALKFHAGLSNAEIGALLGVSESNAGTRVHRAVTTMCRFSSGWRLG